MALGSGGRFGSRVGICLGYLLHRGEGVWLHRIRRDNEAAHLCSNRVRTRMIALSDAIENADAGCGVVAFTSVSQSGRAPSTSRSRCSLSIPHASSSQYADILSIAQTVELVFTRLSMRRLPHPQQAVELGNQSLAHLPPTAESSCANLRPVSFLSFVQKRCVLGSKMEPSHAHLPVIRMLINESHSQLHVIDAFSAISRERIHKVFGKAPYSFPTYISNTLFSSSLIVPSLPTYPSITARPTQLDQENPRHNHSAIQTMSSAPPPPPKNPFTGDPKQYAPDHFANSATGTCLCGSISVTVHAPIHDIPDMYICHCANCRKVSGSYAAPNLRVPRSKVVIEDRKGTIKKYEDFATGSGNVVERYFCAGCGS